MFAAPRLSVFSSASRSVQVVSVPLVVEVCAVQFVVVPASSAFVVTTRFGRAWLVRMKLALNVP